MVMAKSKGKVRFSVVNIVLRPLTTFIYNYFFRLGFLDGREGLLLHLYHAVYVSWKYAKAWELSRGQIILCSLTDRSFDPHPSALLVNAGFLMIGAEHWGSYGEEII